MTDVEIKKLASAIGDAIMFRAVWLTIGVALFEVAWSHMR